MTSWIVLQLADSAFPTGGFAHSAGLEATLQARELASPEPEPERDGRTQGRGIEQFATELVDQLAQGSLPIVAAAHDDPARLGELDAFTRATLWSHVAARASRNQGRALLDVAARSFGHEVLLDARGKLTRPGVADRDRPSSGPAPCELEGHLAPVFGFVTRALGLARDEALATFLHLGLRGALSAAVRLGCIGPSEGQALHHRLHPVLDAALARARTLALDDVAQTAPLVELLQATQDRLYSRLFQS